MGHQRQQQQQRNVPTAKNPPGKSASGASSSTATRRMFRDAAPTSNTIPGRRFWGPEQNQPPPPPSPPNISITNKAQGGQRHYAKCTIIEASRCLADIVSYMRQRTAQNRATKRGCHTAVIPPPPACTSRKQENKKTKPDCAQTHTITHAARKAQHTTQTAPTYEKRRAEPAPEVRHERKVTVIYRSLYCRYPCALPAVLALDHVSRTYAGTVIICMLQLNALRFDHNHECPTF